MEDDSTTDIDEEIALILTLKHHLEYEELWKKGDALIVAKVLKCHLIIEYCLNKWLKHRAGTLNLESAKLTFSQKLLIFSKTTKDKLLSDAIDEVNKLRNKVAHTFHDPFDAVQIPNINRVCKTLQDKLEHLASQNMYALEAFTIHCCAWVEGEMMVDIRDVQAAHSYNPKGQSN